MPSDYRSILDYPTLDMPKQTVLNFDKVGATLPVGLHRPDLRFEQSVLDQLHARLTAYVLTERLANDTQTESIQVPANWRAHAKEAFINWGEKRRVVKRLAWWIENRWPIEYRTATLSVTWKRSATRPESTLRVRDLGPVVYQEQMSSYLDWSDR